MIGSLRGVLLESGPELLVEVAGVGYRVTVTPTTASLLGPAGREVFVHIHHHRRDDAEVLFGFADAEERRVFEQLISTHGVGPALGLAILATHTPEVLRRVVATDDVAALCLVPGVGRKTAARLLIELKSKLEVSGDVASPVVGGAAAGVLIDVREGLEGLGYSAEEIARATEGMSPEGDVSVLLREALTRLAAG